MSIHLQAWREFAARYARVLKDAWSVRHTLDSPQRTNDEVEFLPAHLELIERPVSPTSRWTMRAIIAIFVAATLWSVLGQLDMVAVASGRTLVSSRTKVIQPLEPGVVRRILVRDGEYVRRDQPLIELDSTAARAEYAQATEALADARAAQARYAALKEGLRLGKLPDEWSTDGVGEQRLSAARALARSEFDRYQSRKHALSAALAQRRAELQTLQAELGPLQQSVQIAHERSTDLQRLLGTKDVSRHDYLRQEMERAELDRSLAGLSSRRAESEAAIAAANEDLRVLDAEMLEGILDELRRASEQVAQLEASVSKTANRAELMTLRAPVDGTVQQLAVHTVGGVVTEAQPLLAIVPEQDSLEVEATVLNKDIGFVRRGQPVVVKIESFPYTRYGFIEGVVESISHDATQHETLGLVFLSRVKLQQSTLTIDDVVARLTPGMAVTVEIKTGRQRVIQYLLAPLQRHGNEAMRER